jgi:predicted outer membrane repeat protein
LECLEDRWLPSTLTVLNNLDSGAGSLRAEIAAAHIGDTIVFAPSLDGQTITLTSGELLIKHNLTITGPGARQLAVSGNNASRVFEVSKTANSVTLSGLTIRNGVANGVGLAGEGGGILNHSTLTVSGSTLSGNSATQDGGGIHNDGTLTISNSTLSGNSARPGGGGIYNDGTLTVSGSTLSGNSGISGGGINNDGTLTVSGSTLSGNSANYGGGIWNLGTATVSASTLSGNSASYGGGIYDQGGTLTVNSSTLSGNSANYGGGIDNYAGTLTVSGSILSGNSATLDGGGIYNSVYGTATVKNYSSITGNTARVGFGADAYNAGVLYLDSTSIIGILNGNGAIPI